MKCTSPLVLTKAELWDALLANDSNWVSVELARSCFQCVANAGSFLCMLVIGLSFRCVRVCALPMARTCA
eukprot:1151754-Pleurochrysis_carterae.AAC.1